MAESTYEITPEHASPTVSTSNTEYTPTDAEKKTISLVNRLFEKAKTHRKKYDEKWLDFYKMFRGKQWKENRPSYRHSEVINFIFQAIQGQVPVLTDARSRFEFLPQEPQDMEVAEILSEVAESDWERGNWLMRLTEIIYDGKFFGNGFGAVEFIPKARHGAGAIDFSSWDPFYCFPDPNAKEINDDKRTCRYFIYAEPVDVEVVKRENPTKKDFIKPDLIDLMQGDKTNLDQVTYKSPVDNKTIVEGSSANEVGHKDQVLRLTCYLFSDEFDEEKKETPNADGTLSVEYEQRLRYPNGRKIVMASGVVLSDGPNPYEDGLIPVAKFTNYILPREFWGMGEIEQLESPQKIFNKLVSFSLDVLTLMGNPVWKVGTGSGVDTDNLFNRPGLIIEADNIDQVQREEGVSLQPYVLQLIDRMQDWFDGISGRTDVTQGVNPAGVTAASAITALQESAQTRMRQQGRQMDAFLQSAGQLYKNRVFQFKTAPEIYRLTGKDGAQKYFRFHIDNRVDPMTGEPQRVVVVRPYAADPASGQMAEQPAREYIMRGDFDVKVSTGSSLPFAKTEKINTATMLFDRGALDEPALLEACDYPNWEAVWQRVEARKQAQAQAQAQAAQQQEMAKAQAKQASAPPPQVA